MLGTSEVVAWRSITLVCDTPLLTQNKHRQRLDLAEKSTYRSVFGLELQATTSYDRSSFVPCPTWKQLLEEWRAASRRFNEAGTAGAEFTSLANVRKEPRTNILLLSAI